MADTYGQRELEKRKNTELLQSELKHAESMETFIQANQTELTMKSVAEYLMDLMIRYNAEKSDISKRGGFGGNYVYQIFNGAKSASRDKLIQIALGFPLALEETQCLLRLGGYAELYVRNSRDAFIMFALEKGYDVQKTNDLLYENNKKILE